MTTQIMEGWTCKSSIPRDRSSIHNGRSYALLTIGITSIIIGIIGILAHQSVLGKKVLDSLKKIPDSIGGKDLVLGVSIALVGLPSLVLLIYIAKSKRDVDTTINSKTFDRSLMHSDSQLRALSQTNWNAKLEEAIFAGNQENIITLFVNRSKEERLQALVEPKSDGIIALRIAWQSQKEAIESLLEDFQWSDRLQILVGIGNTAMTARRVFLDLSQTKTIREFSRLSPEKRLQILIQPNERGELILVTAAKSGQATLSQALLEGLASNIRLQALMQQDRTGQTALEAAVWGLQTEVITALLMGLSSNDRLQLLLQQIENRDPVLIAAIMGFAEQEKKIIIFKILLDGLSLYEKRMALAQKGCGDWRHFTALDICVAKGQNELLALLVSFQAPCSIDQPLSDCAINDLLRMRFGMKPEADFPSPAAYRSLDLSLKCSIEQTGYEKIRNRLSKIESDFSNAALYQFLPVSIIVQHILEGRHVVIATGWIGHSTAVVFANNLVMKCNRGDRPHGTISGITVFAPSSVFSHAAIDTLTYAIEMLRKKNQEFFHEGLNTLLKLNSVTLNEQEAAFAKRKDQKDGYCILASAKTALLALCLDTFRDTPEDLALADKFYKDFTFFDRKRSIMQNLSWAVTHPKAAARVGMSVSVR